MDHTFGFRRFTERVCPILKLSERYGCINYLIQRYYDFNAIVKFSCRIRQEDSSSREFIKGVRNFTGFCSEDTLCVRKKINFLSFSLNRNCSGNSTSGQHLPGYKYVTQLSDISLKISFLWLEKRGVNQNYVSFWCGEGNMNSFIQRYWIMCFI